MPHPEPKKQEKEIYLKWLQMTRQEREESGIPTKTAFAKKYGVHLQAIMKWDKREAKRIKREGFDADSFLNDGSPDAMRALMAAVASGNAQAMKIYFDIIGKTGRHAKEPEKKEFSPDEWISAAREARRQLEKEGYAVGKCVLCGSRLAGGVGEVPDERSLLPEQVRLHNEQEHGADSEVGTLAVSA